jgi:hypothetical protein
MIIHKIICFTLWVFVTPGAVSTHYETLRFVTRSREACELDKSIYMKLPHTIRMECKRADPHEQETCSP